MLYKGREMDSFHINSYFSVALNVETQVIHIYKNTCSTIQIFFFLKGHSQPVHMRITYHFLADLHITRHARETEGEMRIRYLNI